jgi:hypothetical protein
MVSLTQLWLPILLSAVFVFVVSSLIHMVFKWHNSDYRQLPNEDAVRAAFKGAGAEPGMYVIPHCKEMKDMGSPEMAAKFEEGPNGMVFLRPTGMPGIGKSLGQWFVLSLFVAFTVAYLAGMSLHSGAECMLVFRFTATATFLAYATGSVIMGIWMGQPWGAVIKDVFDGLLYALVTGGAFCWRWPH